MLDQIESEVIEGRPDLINGFTCNDGNVVGRTLGKLKIVAAVRLWDNSIRLTFCVVENEIAYSVNVFRCPDEFKISGIKTLTSIQQLTTIWLVKAIITGIGTHHPGGCLRATSAQFTTASAIVTIRITDWPKSTRVARITHNITPSAARKFPAGRWNIAFAPSGCLRRNIGSAAHLSRSKATALPQRESRSI